MEKILQVSQEQSLKMSILSKLQSLGIYTVLLSRKNKILGYPISNLTQYDKNKLDDILSDKTNLSLFNLLLNSTSLFTDNKENQNEYLKQLSKKMDQLAIEQNNIDIILSELNQGERKILNNIVKIR